MLTEQQLCSKRARQTLKRTRIMNARQKNKGDTNCSGPRKMSAFEIAARADWRVWESMKSRMNSVTVKTTGLFTKAIKGIQNMIGMHR